MKKMLFLILLLLSPGTGQATEEKLMWDLSESRQTERKMLILRYADFLERIERYSGDIDAIFEYARKECSKYWASEVSMDEECECYYDKFGKNITEQGKEDLLMQDIVLRLIGKRDIWVTTLANKRMEEYKNKIMNECGIK